MTRVARLAIPLATLLVVAPASSTSAAPAGGPVAVAAQYHCRGFTLRGDRFHVTVYKGHVRCRRARGVLRAFMSGKGRMHGPRNGPAYKQWWSVRGWRCGHGAGGGGCSRHGRLIEAYWV